MCCWLAPVISALHVVSLLDHSNANIVGLQKVTILRRFCGFTLYSHTTQRYAKFFYDHGQNEKHSNEQAAKGK